MHGASFTKEDWKKSGILDMLCDINNEEDEGNLSISALDLPVSADGKQLVGMAFDTLVSDRVLSGRAATFVSPIGQGPREPRRDGLEWQQGAGANSESLDSGGSPSGPQSSRYDAGAI